MQVGQLLLIVLIFNVYSRKSNATQHKLKTAVLILIKQSNVLQNMFTLYDRDCGAMFTCKYFLRFVEVFDVSLR